MYLRKIACPQHGFRPRYRSKWGFGGIANVRLGWLGLDYLREDSFAFFKVWAQRLLLPEDVEFPPQAAACAAGT